MLGNPSSCRLHCTTKPFFHFHPNSKPKSNRPKRLVCPPISKTKYCSLSLLLPRKNRKAFGIRALTDPTAGAAAVSAQPYSVKIPVGDRHILVETGHIGRQASASVTVTDGERLLFTHLFVWLILQVNLQTFSLFPFIIKSVFPQLVALVEAFSNEKEGQKITRFSFAD